jgi:hypothetical protein
VKRLETIPTIPGLFRIGITCQMRGYHMQRWPSSHPNTNSFDHGFVQSTVSSCTLLVVTLILLHSRSPRSPIASPNNTKSPCAPTELILSLYDGQGDHFGLVSLAPTSPRSGRASKQRLSDRSFFSQVWTQSTDSTYRFKGLAGPLKINRS